MRDVWPVTAIALIVVGAFLATQGLKLIEYVIWVVAAIAVFYGLSYVVFKILFQLEIKIANVVEWILVICILVVGVLAGRYLKDNRKMGLALLAGVAGIMAGAFVCTTLSIPIPLNFYLCLICFIAAFCMMCVVETTLIIGSTSFIGSFMFVKGIGTIFGKFPDMD